MAELAASMSSGVSDDQVPLGIGEPQIVWPSVEDVRTSIEVRSKTQIHRLLSGFFCRNWFTVLLDYR